MLARFLKKIDNGSSFRPSNNAPLIIKKMGTHQRTNAEKDTSLRPVIYFAIHRDVGAAACSAYANNCKGT